MQLSHYCDNDEFKCHYNYQGPVCESVGVCLFERVRVREVTDESCKVKIKGLFIQGNNFVKTSL